MYVERERRTSRWRHCTEKIRATKTLILSEDKPESGGLCPCIFNDFQEENDIALWWWSRALQGHDPDPRLTWRWLGQLRTHFVQSDVSWFPLLTGMGSESSGMPFYAPRNFISACLSNYQTRPGGGWAPAVPSSRKSGPTDSKVTPTPPATD